MAVPWMAAAAVADSAFGLVGQGIANKANRQAQSRDQLYNEKMWAKQNAYNHPTAQMSRLKEAGLNPHLIYGTSPSSAVGTAGELKAAQRNPMESVTKGLTPFSNFMSFKNLQAQTNNVKANTEVAEQEALNKALAGEGMTYDNAIKKINAGVHPDLTKSQLQAAQANVENIRANTLKTEANTKTINELRAPQVARAIEDVLLAKETLRGKDLENQIRAIEYELNRQGISVHDNVLLRQIFLKGAEAWDGMRQALDNFSK